MNRFALILCLLAACSGSSSNDEPERREAGPPFKIATFSTAGDGGGTLEIEFSWSIDDPQERLERCTLDPGDGTAAFDVDCPEGTATHTYAADGSYTATLTGAAADETASATVAVEVAPLPAEGPAWARQFAAEAGAVHGHGLDVDAAGNAYLVGDVGSNAVVAGASESAGGEDLFVAKIDPEGNTVWIRQLGTVNNDSGWALEVDSAGSVYIAGHTVGDFGGESAGTHDAFLLKLGPDGESIWIAQLGSSHADFGFGVAVHETSGDVFLAGSTSGAIEGATGTGGGFVARYSAAGVRAWAIQYEVDENAVNHNARGLAVDAAGTAYVTGWVDSDLTMPSGQAYLVAVSGDGSVSLRKTFGVEGVADHGKVVAVSADGVYVGGSTRGSLGGAYNNGWDSFVVAFDFAGTQRWAAQDSGDLDDHTYGLDFDAAGNVYAAGESYAKAGDNRAVVASYAPDGTLRWSGEVDGARSWGYELAVTPSGTVLVSGDTGSNLDGESQAGGFVDAFVATVGPGQETEL